MKKANVTADEFALLQEREQFLDAIAEGIEDFLDQKTISDEELEERLQKRYGKSRS